MCPRPRGATEHGRCNGAHVLCYVGSYGPPSRFDIDSGPSTYGDALGPPTEACGGPDEIGPPLECRAPGELGVLQVLDSGNVLVWLRSALLVSGHRCSAGNYGSERGHAASVTSATESWVELSMLHPIEV
jgi:hypothetical protein